MKNEGKGKLEIDAANIQLMDKEESLRAACYVTGKISCNSRESYPLTLSESVVV